MKARRSNLFVPAAILSFFAAVLVWTTSDRTSAKKTFPEFSTFSTAPEGLSVAKRYLESRRGKLGIPSVGTSTRVLDPSEVKPATVLLRIAPAAVPWLEAAEEEVEKKKKKKDEKDQKKTGVKPAKDTKKEKEKEKEDEEAAVATRRRYPLLTDGEEEFIRRGGRMVLAIRTPYGPLDVTEARRPSPLSKVFPIWPGTASFEPPIVRSLGGDPLQRTVALFTHENNVAIGRMQAGRGEVILMAVPEIFSNEYISDHLALLEGLTQGRPVLFDEASHGIRSDAGLLELLRRWKLGPLLALMALTFAFAGWRKASRLGEPDDDFIDRRSEAIDLVDSLAHLYHRVLRRHEALTLYLRSLERAVAHQTGLHGAELQARVDLLTGGLRITDGGRKEDIPEPLFQRHLTTINEAFGRLRNARKL